VVPILKKFFLRPYSFAIVFSVLLMGSFTYVLLDTFVIPKSYAKVVTDNSSTDPQTASDTQEGVTDDSSKDGDTDSAQNQSDAVVTDTSYEDDNIKINISTLREYDTSIYIADVQVSDISYLKTALAENTYGRNIKAATSDIAGGNSAILAINGDFYGFRNYGYVLRNGELYRDSAGDAEDLVIDDTGNFSIIDESETSVDSLDLSSIWQILSFGPALIEDGTVAVDENSEVSRSMTSNPRTAIGMISPLHYVFVVSDGRTDESSGLSLIQLAQVLKDLGCTTAYNLDGGGSSTMYFNGEVVNIPTDGRTYGEREVSDIVYIGY
jgi:exopolysaccharide biosynthesis protein